MSGKAVPRGTDCHKCKKSLVGCKAICANQKWYHPECFCCVSCSTKLSLKYCEVNGEPYCTACWAKKFAPKCSGCQKPIEGSECVTLLGKDFHQDCAKCTKCKKMLSGDQYFPFKEVAYCFECHWKVRQEVHQQRQQQQVDNVNKPGATT